MLKIRPFSPWRYILDNKLRAFVLILMMSFISVTFLTGMYVDNPPEIFRVSDDPTDDYIYIYRKANSKEATAQRAQMLEELEEYLPANAQTIIPAYSQYMDFDSIMSFNCAIACFTFSSVEDFEIFKARTHMIPDDVVLHDQEMVMSEYLANNKGLKVGDIEEKSGFRVARIMSSWEGVRSYAVDESSIPGNYMVVASEDVDEVLLDIELNETVEQLRKKYPLIEFSTQSKNQEEELQDFEFVYYIFGAASLLLDIVLLVMINAVFTAAYDKRKHEFAIYKAIGFTRGQIFRKIAGEVLIMNAIALLIGVAVNAGVILVCNQLLWNQGQYFYRISKIALIATIISEVFFLFSIILLNWRKTRKYEVTEE